MKRLPIIILFVFLWTYLPGESNRGNKMEQLKNEIIEVEKRFAEMAAEKGVKAAFLHFAAQDAVLMRNDRLIRGKKEIGKYFDASELTDIRLKWKPGFVDVSSSGDMAYTYGRYTFSAKDKNGKVLKSEGIFHTVWKRQQSGEWRYVWD